MEKEKKKKIKKSEKWRQREQIQHLPRDILLPPSYVVPSVTTLSPFFCSFSVLHLPLMSQQPYLRLLLHRATPTNLPNLTLFSKVIKYAPFIS